MKQSFEEELPQLEGDDVLGDAAVPQSGLAAKADADAEFRSGIVPESVLRIPVAIQVVIGSTRLTLSRVAQLGPGSVLTLDQKLGTPATILVNGKEVAKGELFVLDGKDQDGRLGITITEVATPGCTPKS